MSTMEPLVELLRAAQMDLAARLPASRVHLTQPVHLGSPTVEQEAKGYQSHRLPLWWTCMRLLGATCVRDPGISPSQPYSLLLCPIRGDRWPCWRPSVPYDVSASLPKLSPTLGDQHMPSFFVLSPDIVSVHWESMGKLLLTPPIPAFLSLPSASRILFLSTKPSGHSWSGVPSWRMGK